MGRGLALRGRSGCVVLGVTVFQHYLTSWTQVVNEKSACIDGHRKVGLPTDHLKINKYCGPKDPSYQYVYPIIMEMAGSAVKKVQRRLHRMCMQPLFYGLYLYSFKQLKQSSRIIQVRDFTIANALLKLILLDRRAAQRP
jgi:hypothetical protein